jgi:hypothetical protein
MLLNNEDNRGEVLDSLFAGIDLISESDAGRTFNAFWRLLTDPEQETALDHALDSVMSREFVTQLDSKEKRFLLRMTRILLEQGGAVHEVSQNLARSLRHFVQSREYLEQRRLDKLLKDATLAALAIKDEFKSTEALKYTLELTSSRIRSLSQLVLYDPSQRALPDGIFDGDLSFIDLESIGELVAQSEIDFRSLIENIRDVLEKRALEASNLRFGAAGSHVSISEVLEQHPAEQGLGSIVGLVALGSRHGIKIDFQEKVFWVGNDNVQRSAYIPKIFFSQERIHELI